MIKFKDINYPRRKEKEIIINLPNEIWKDVCDGYKVSNYGRVLSLAKTTIRGRKYDKILSASKKDNGYYTVSINGNIKNNISVSAIYNCLYGKSKTCGGYEWIKR
jgi:hypothetical protein